MFQTAYSARVEQVRQGGRLVFERITFDPQIMGGRACIRGMRITVSQVLRLIASEMTVKEILEAYPYLEQEDLKVSLQYAAFLADEEVIYPVAG
jgi:uncharacterized protein (DUF433 family)